MPDLLHHLLTASPDPEPLPDTAAWWRRHRAAVQAFETPVARSDAGGAISRARAARFEAAWRRLRDPAAD